MSDLPSFALSDLLTERATSGDRRAFLARASALGAVLGGAALAGCGP